MKYLIFAALMGICLSQEFLEIKEEQDAPAVKEVTDGEGDNAVWQKAAHTYYWSYPRCCKDSPNYDPKAPKDEC